MVYNLSMALFVFEAAEQNEDTPLNKSYAHSLYLALSSALEVTQSQDIFFQEIVDQLTHEPQSANVVDVALNLLVTKLKFPNSSIFDVWRRSKELEIYVSPSDFYNYLSLRGLLQKPMEIKVIGISELFRDNKLTSSALQRNGIGTLKQLINLTLTELGSLDRIGKTNIQHVLQMLTPLGYSLLTESQRKRSKLDKLGTDGAVFSIRCKIYNLDDLLNSEFLTAYKTNRNSANELGRLMFGMNEFEQSTFMKGWRKFNKLDEQ